MNEVNQYGLSRGQFRDPIKRLVRQRCGFGCIVCGTALIEYHHFDPPFKDAREHRAEGITLLCSHCHSRVGRDFDDDFIWNHNQNPRCLQKGYTRDIFYIGCAGITFKLGGAWFKRLDVILYDQEPLISFSPPEAEGGPFRLNATLYDKDQQELLKIINNEWLAGTKHYDVEIQKNQLIIREKRSQVKLKLSAVAEKEISIEKLDMNYNGYRILVEKGQLQITSPDSAQMHLTCPSIFSPLYLSSNGGIRVGNVN